ncbi:MAG TPA: MFS transporter [Pirellulales bacterium]|nr:MFS transporter [Pirellulales bacterium]
MPEPRKGSLLVIFLAVFIDLLGFGMVLPLLSIYARDFGEANNGMVIGLLVASFSAMQFIFSPMWGRLSDRIGRRPVLMIGLAGSVVFYTLFGLATVWRSIAWLFVSRIGAGIAGATITTAQAYIADVTTLENRGKGMALVGAAFGLGFTFGPMFGGLALLGNTSNPRPEPGYAAAALSACGLLFAYFMLPESLNPESKSAGKRLFDFGALRTALKMPSVGPLLLTLFVCILAFANFETTLPLLLSGGQNDPVATANASESRALDALVPVESRLKTSPFHFDLKQVLLTFSYIGFTLTVAQGLFVRRLLGVISEGTMAAIGALTDILGFVALVAAIQTSSKLGLFGAVTLMVFGFAMMMPSLNSLISRRSDPAKQGSILGIGQSVSALARILGPMLGLPLLEQTIFLPIVLPYVVGAVLMAVGLLMIITSARGGHDYGAAASGSLGPQH